MRIQFLGAAGEVTGSKYAVEMELDGRSRRIMIDYGMFQGGREALEQAGLEVAALVTAKDIVARM